MTTLEAARRFPSPRSTDTADFVSSDTAALASHMSRCASSRGRFFGLQSLLELAHAHVSTRMVTAGVVGLVLVGLVGIV